MKAQSLPIRCSCLRGRPVLGGLGDTLTRSEGDGVLLTALRMLDGVVVCLQAPNLDNVAMQTSATCAMAKKQIRVD